jgi:hypothetical protein
MNEEAPRKYVSPVDETHPVGVTPTERITEGSSDEVRVVVGELAEALASRFELVERLGAGGMGIVLLARDPLLARNVAIKILAPHLAHDADHRARFIREAQAAAAVAHPNIVAIHLVGELPRSRVPYFVMQHVEGRTLDALFPRSDTVPEPDAKRILGEVAHALATAHERGIVHRDIKPSNVMVEEGTHRVVVLDFGISSVTALESDAPAKRGNYIGTPRYMSPEQAAGSPTVTPKSDSYSFGCVAFELMTGKPPFEGNSPLVLMSSHLDEAPPDIATRRPDLSPRFARLVNRCLLKDPALRPSSDEIRRTLAPPQALLEWPPRIALPMRDAIFRAMIWLNVAASLLIIRYGALLLLPMPQQLRSALAMSETMAFEALAVGLTGAIALAELAIAFSRWRALDNLGYGAWPILDILGDHDGRTGELILAQHRFAALTDTEQRAVAAARVFRAGARNLLLPSAALAAVVVELVARVTGPSTIVSWSFVAAPAIVWAIVWFRSVQIERRLVGESTAASARQSALADARRLQSRWLDRYWGAWRGVERTRDPSAGILLQRILVATIIVATLLACIVLGYVQLFTSR